MRTLEAAVTEHKTWTMCPGAAQLVDYHQTDDARPLRQRRPMDMLMLGLAIEKASADFKDKKWAFYIDGCIHLLSRPSDMTVGASGM